MLFVCLGLRLTLPGIGVSNYELGVCPEEEGIMQSAKRRFYERTDT